MLYETDGYWVAYCIVNVLKDNLCSLCFFYTIYQSESENVYSIVASETHTHTALLHLRQ